jgi:hypothetical protein
MKKAVLLLMILTIVQSLSAQHINNVFAFKAEQKSAMMMNLELDPALFWGISYNRSFDLKIGEFERRVSAQSGWKSYQFNYNDLNLNLFTTAWNPKNKLNMILNFGAENKYLENKIHQANVYNWVLSIMPGYFTDQWYVGAEIQHKWLYGVKYEHTDFYKEIYPEVKDGWYYYKNAYWNLSLNAGVKLTASFDIDLRAGYRFTDDFENYEPYLNPYFGNVALNYRFR